MYSEMPGLILPGSLRWRDGGVQRYGIGVNDFEASSLVGYLTVLTSGVPFCAQSDTADGSRPKAKCSYGLWWWCATTCGLKMVLTRFGW